MTTPVLILAHRRPSQLAQCVRALQEAGAKNVYASVDGPIEDNDIQNSEVKTILNGLTPSLVDHQFLPENLGCKQGVETGIDWFFDKVEFGIIIEEDVIVSKAGFNFFSRGLEEPKSDFSVQMICGHVPTGSWGNNNKPFSSTIGTIWGWATWANHWKKHRSAPDVDLNSAKKIISKTFSDTTVAKRFEAAFALIADGKLDTWDFQWNLSILANQGKCAFPSTNQIENIGIEADALHTKSLHPEVCNSIQELNSPVDFKNLKSIDLSFEMDWFRRLSGKSISKDRHHSESQLSSIDINENLKVASVNTTDLGGGAEKIFRQLSTSQVDVFGLVKVKKSDNPRVHEISIRNRFLSLFPDENLKRNLAQIGTSTDLIHIHNLHDTGLTLKEVLKIADEKPIIWTIHDQWLLADNPEHPFSSAGRIPPLNQRIFDHKNIHFVSPSLWLQDLVLSKTGRLPTLIRHGVDTDIFKPMNQSDCKVDLGLDQNKKYLLFIANNPKTNPYKDFNTLKKSWIKSNTNLNESYDLICLGSKTKAQEEENGSSIHFIPFENDERTVAKYLNASDCLIHATKSDVSSLSILEALACKTPVISSAIGGIPELLLGDRHGRTFQLGTVPDLVSSIQDFLENPEKTELLSESGYAYVLNNHSMQKMQRSYLGLYTTVIN